MQSRRAIEQHRVTLGHFLQNVPHLRSLALNHLLRAAHRMHVTEVFEPTDDERLEKHQRHLLWQTTLIQFQFRADDNNRTPRIIDAFAEQVLAETSALALEHVAERFERPIACSRHGATMPAVIEQSVYRFLQHSLFVANNDVWRLEQKQVFEPVVPINDAPIK